LKGGENLDKEFQELLILTAQYDVLSAILNNDYKEISACLDYQLSEQVDCLDGRRSEILTNMVKKIAPNAEA
jgi:hypothetical protein